MRILYFIFSLVVCFGVSAQEPIHYELDLTNIQHHELGITITFQQLDQDNLTLQMPNASPGRYALHNFAKNVYEEAAYDQNGKEIKLRRLTPYSWEVPVQDGYVRFRYTIFGNHADGTYMGVDARKLHLNMPATFVYGKELKNREIQLSIPGMPDGWSVATQLQMLTDSSFSAPDYYYFYDSPVMVGEIDWRRWEVAGQTIEIAMMHEGTPEELDNYTEWVKKIVAEQKRIYGSLPDFDFGRYTFLIAYNPWAVGDGMEHRNSTICTSSGSLKENEHDLIGTVAHEFFHAWNIERIRPQSLEPFDFANANMSEALWFGEGFTSYFDDLTLVRTGIITPEGYVNGLIGGLNYVLNSPARAFRSPMEMSHQATFVDAGTANDATNYSNNFVSYYSYGAVIGLGLDLTLRRDFNKTLDDYMQRMWERFGKPEQPYTMQDLQQELADYTNSEFAEEFFTSQIYGSELPDFEQLFADFGIKLSLKNPNSAYFANPKLSREGVVQSTVLRGTAFYDAGIEKGDQIISVDGREVTNTADLNRTINTLQVGQTYTIEYIQLGEIKTGNFTARQDPRITLSFLPEEQLKKRVIKRRAEWLRINN
ncbi:M61 family metallopeptidase [Marinoscillum furvescens]|uniref:Putative metalloprotease with PDZ domain n=1 Tax=Marinoscillum furvescens DSM 4134 TaxID=1122208 RepID=A0A3D9L1U2_MARFU|nr:PDZ domain-containing protein [Marinoscillum furvescens]RED97065.1 putative metalloprotease with PDZ domain [Marinoscillum furvescens DSM 4134]